MAGEPPARRGISLPPAPEGGYRLNRPYPLLPGDVITVTVREEPDLNITVTIDSTGILEVYKSEKDGKERETILVLGKTVEEVRDEIAAVYQRVRFNFKPYVQVLLSNAVPRVVSVRGAVKSESGTVALPPGSRMTLCQALQAGGGWTEDADLSRVSIERRDPSTGAKVSLPEYDLDEMIDTAAYDRDPPLEPNDIITVPVLGEVTIHGNINQPGRYRCRRKLTLLDLLSDAGGYKPFSKLSDVRVTRDEGSGREQTYRVDVEAILDGKALDPKLARGDRVWIDETWR
jgi:protein involved in polysaccharide export with SLBB domain